MIVAASNSGSGGSAALGFVLIILGIIAYWTPGIVAWARHVPNVGSVMVINGFLGWTLVGWVVALAMACRSRPPQQVMVQQVTVGGQDPGQQPPPQELPPPVRPPGR